MEPTGGVNLKSVFTVDMTRVRKYDNGGNVNKLLLSYSLVATGLPVRTETITMTDMKQSATLLTPHCMLGAKQARRRVKPGPGTLLGKTNYHWWKKGESFCLSPDHIFTITLYHLRWGLPPWWRRGGFFVAADLVVGMVKRCIFTLWSLASQKSVPSPLVLWRPSQLVWKR